MTSWGTPNRKTTPNVVTHAGWDDPTKKQLKYLEYLAGELGVKTPKVTTIGGASRAIDRLKERLHEKGKEVEEMESEDG